MKRPSILSLSLIVMFGCIDPINFDVSSNSDNNIVVDALITDKEGKSRVIISKSVGYFEYSSNEFLKKVSGANVTLDAVSEEISFTELSPGSYMPPSDFKAIEGVDYKLVIELDDGKKYESVVQRLVKNAGIENIKKNYNYRTILSKNNVEVSKGGVELFLNTNSVGSNNKYYRWQFTGTYQIETRPDLGEPVPTCSGIEINPDTGLDEGTGICTCCICWVTESENLILSDPTFVEGQIRNVPIIFIENSEGRFQEKYHYSINQISISREEHEFWRLIKTQKEQASLFAQQVGQIPSNIYSLGDKQSQVLGYFSVSSVVSTSGFLNASDVPERISALPILAGSCLGFKNASNIKPPFWE